ncbi:MAG: PAS domain S-box protein, partial [Pseudomonadota bacterium]
YITDMAGNIVAANARASSELGCSNQELLQLNIIDLDAVFTTPELVAEHFKALAESKAMTFETIHRRKDGSQFPVEINVRLIDFDGRPSVMGVARNISARRQAERVAADTRQQLEVIFDTMQAGIIQVNPQGVITFANRRMASMFGCKIDELIGSSYPEHVHPDQRGVGDERMRRPIAGEIDHVHHERHYIRGDGSSFWGHLSGRRLEDGQGNLISLIGVIADISQMKKMHEALDYTNQCFTQALSGGQQILYRLNVKKGCYDYLSPAFERLTGYPVAEFSKTSLEKLPEYFHPDDRQRIFNYIDEQFASRTVCSINFDMEYRFRKADGSYCWFHDTNTAVFNEQDELECFFGSVHDISDRKQAEQERLKLEQQLLHAQKLESLGVLAGGIAHDFNNILTAIIGNADLALMRINLESPAVENLRRIEKAASQAADLAKQMLAYSGKGKFVVEHLDINLLLEEMLHMLQVSISKKSVLRFNLTKPLPTVEADATQMRQIIMNLVINASEAIGDKSGVIAVSTGCMDCDESYLKDVWLDENLDQGLYVYLEISDSGCGMDRDTMAKLFDPFFTTKFTGRGLGMAAVLGIVRGHRGAIKVYSEPGRGATFKILLPSSGRPSEIFNCESKLDEWRGSGTVLLVDDEETVRGIGVEMLRELGFDTITANDGRQALEVFKSTPGISFVIMDLTMPHMDGEQCFRELRRLDADVRVIMSSGYNEYEVSQKFAGKRLAGFIQKPYKLSTLRTVIRGMEGE